MSITSSEENTTRDLRPRRYQEEIFERAQKGNVIAALDTGSGKTLIGLLLIKWISALEGSKGKLIIFLVPRVTLVDQQTKYLRDNTPLRVSRLSGALEIELSDRIRWKRRLQQCDVFVMTPQILVNLLTHSLLSLQRVALLVFDECHHTRKNHPYNIIMREYFHIKLAGERPKIFGMTASPVWNTKDPIGSLLSLETNLDSTIISVREHVEELAAHAPRPSEWTKIYPAPPEKYDFHEPTLFQCLSIISPSTWDHIDVPWSNLVTRYDATLYNLGPYCASLYLFLEVRNALKCVQSGPSPTGAMEMDTMDLVPAANNHKKAPSAEVALIQDIIADFGGFFWKSGNPNIVPILIPTSWCTPKLSALKDILLEFHTTDFQAIVFVEQRQVAACLSKVLSAIPELKDTIRSAHLVGQGATVDGTSKSTDTYHGDAIQAFREGKVNVLIATSVAEEGLDFPACDLVIRFDPFRHMVAYVQSRGRARNATSKFIVMIRQDDQDAFNLYQSLRAHEPEMNRAYQFRQRTVAPPVPLEQLDEDDDEELDASDLAGRERYVVPSTGAILTYDNAIGLLSYLCALIPCDAYTLSHKPKFTEDFKSTVKLPLSIPLPPEQLTYTGPIKHSKKEAKRAVAFMAVKHLHELDVFDEYLLPAPGKTLGEDEVAPVSSHQPQDTSAVLTVDVKFPWTLGDRLWLHPIYVKGEPVAGLIAGAPLPLVELRSDVLLRLGRPHLLRLEQDDELEQRRMMHEYTRLGIFYRLTGTPLANVLSTYLVPLTDDSEVDFNKIRRVVDNPAGISDWSSIRDDQDGRLLVLNRPEYGRTRVLQRIRNDLSPLSTPPEGSAEATCSTYHEYWTSRWSRPGSTYELPRDGPLLEAPRLVKRALSKYSINSDHRIPPIDPDAVVSPMVPMRLCGWVDMSPALIRAFELLPALCQKLTDTYRAQAIRSHIGLPLISDDLLIEALTLPSVDTYFSNQRLETLGDAVLDICTTVHMMIKYPTRHEGQLTNLRQRVISNKYLVSCARAVGLEAFISSERYGSTKWPFVEQAGYENKEFRERKTAVRQVPRRGLQDCVEALLGASFIAGGIPMALQTGVAFGLSFGGFLPWGDRTRKTDGGDEVPALIANLEKELGYTFRNPELMVEAVTHPSFESSTTPSYQRLEFLGDSVIKMVVTIYLFNKFPKATSHQLHLPRTKAVCSPALAFLAVHNLKVHKYLLHNSVNLNHAIKLYLPILEGTSADEIVRRGWRYDPPKALSDLFESIVGAVFVDSGYDLDRTGATVAWLMDDILEALSPSTPKDPVSELLEWLASVGCSGHMKFRITPGQKDGTAVEGVSAVFHDTVVAGPIVSGSKNVARFAVAEKALVALRDMDSGKLLGKICDCKHRMAVDEEEKDVGANRKDILNEEEVEVADMLIE